MVWGGYGPEDRTWVPRSYFVDPVLEFFYQANPLAIGWSPGVSRREGGPVAGAPVATPTDQVPSTSSRTIFFNQPQLHLIQISYKDSPKPALWTESMPMRGKCFVLLVKAKRIRCYDNPELFFRFVYVQILTRSLYVIFRPPLTTAVPPAVPPSSHASSPRTLLQLPPRLIHRNILHMPSRNLPPVHSSSVIVFCSGLPFALAFPFLFLFLPLWFSRAEIIIL